MKYRREIDGLRALAILPVVLFHIKRNLLPGGYIGVDIFFVISGYLISTILLKEHEEGRFSFRKFWYRRVRRILPILTVVVFLTLVGTILFSYGPDIPEFGHYGIAALLSYANLAHWLQAGNYWGNAAEDSPFLHTWSLSVEEQFYLFFPIVLYLLVKYARRWLFPFFLVVVLLSFSLYIYGSLTHPYATFYLLPTRAWEIGVGVLVAILMQRRGDELIGKGRWYAPAVVLFSIGAICWSFGHLGASGGDTQIALFVPVFATALIIFYAGNSSTKCLGTKILSSPAVVGVGILSYGMYLWHWPLLVFWKGYWGHELGVSQILLFLLIVTLLSYLSYHFVENVFRKPGSSLRLILGAWLAVIVFSASLTFVNAHENVARFQPTIWYGELYNVNPVRTWSEHLSSRMYGIETPVPSIISPDLYRSGITRQYGSESPDILVFGDSHGLMWSKVLDEIANELGSTITFFTADATTPFFPVPPVIKRKGTNFFSAQQKYEFELAKYQRLTKKPPRLLIILTPWGSYEDARRVKPLLDLALKKKIDVFTISQPPFLTFGDKNAPQYISFRARESDSNGDIYLEDYDHAYMSRNDYILNYLSKAYRNLKILDISKIFLKNEGVLVEKDRRVLYIDDDHLSYAGARLAKQQVKDCIEKILRN